MLEKERDTELGPGAPAGPWRVLPGAHRPAVSCPDGDERRERTLLKGEGAGKKSWHSAGTFKGLPSPEGGPQMPTQELPGASSVSAPSGGKHFRGAVKSHVCAPPKSHA